MNNLEAILIIYLLVSYGLGVIMIFTVYFAPKKVSDIIFIIWFVVALPITLPIVLYKWKRRKRKQIDDSIKDKGEIKMLENINFRAWSIEFKEYWNVAKIDFRKKEVLVDRPFIDGLIASRTFKFEEVILEQYTETDGIIHE